MNVPVPNAKSISVLGKLRLVRLGQELASLNPSAKIKFRTEYFSFLLRHRDCWKFVFRAVKERLKEANFKRESEQIILHGSLAFTIAQY